MPRFVALVNVPLAAAVAEVSTLQATVNDPGVPPLDVAPVKTVCQQGCVKVAHPPVGTVTLAVEPLR